MIVGVQIAKSSAISNALRASNQHAGDEHQHATQADLQRGRNPRRVHVALAESM